ncbi:MAG: Transcription termination factor NusA [Candidatus Uhrbacteria bacterium GW2011_GWE2_41_1153]|nr:MAG: Transcription termination factor NusA [Candidatus Uhrbacteria bacterium GW2011_GWE2_41_1153]
MKTVVEDIPLEELEAIQERQAQKAAERDAMDAAPEELRRPRYDDEDELGESEEGPSFNPKTDIMISDAKVLKMGSEIGDEIKIELPMPGEFGRMAAMTAKQVITQKLREAEREIIFNEYREQEGEVLIGTVQRREGRVVLVDIGKTAGVILPADQVRTEHYDSGQRIKVFVREVSLGPRGPQILLSRASAELVKALFEIEIPEIAENIVEIKAIAREAGSRTKIAVHTDDESIDPIGSCIGQRGVRIQTIITEIGGEKIDVIEWSGKHEKFIENALSPAKISGVELDEENKEAVIRVDKDQLSLAIGRGGQNVRLASELTGWKISVREEVGEEKEVGEGEEEEVESGKLKVKGEESDVKTGAEKVEEVMEDEAIHDEIEKIEESLETVGQEDEIEVQAELSTEEIADDEEEEAEEEVEEVLEDNEE